MNDKNSIGLISSLGETTIEANVSVSSWEGAVDTVGGVMANAGIVTKSYIKAMKKTVRELGPYCVIAPGIAMPHARPEDGVLNTGFSLITLATPVEFGNADNDPVDIVIGFAALDKEGHIEALRELAFYFGDDEFVKYLRAAKNTEDLVKTIKKERKKS